MKNHTVAIIPARGGSKGIPNKNLISLCGKPLLAWTIEQSLQAKGVDSVWVSSDSDEIGDLAATFGAKFIKRPDSLSNDTATSESAWIHAIDEIEKTSGSIDQVIGLQATSPLRESSDIEKGLEIFNNEKLDSLFSAGLLEDFFIWHKAQKGYESLNYDYHNRKRRQDVGEQFVENGSFYIFKPQLIRKTNNRLGGKIGIAPMAFWKSFEIDLQEDLKVCEVLMQGLLLKS